MHIIQKFGKDSQNLLDSIQLDSNNPYLSNTLILKLDEVSIQQVSDAVFIVRCYENGQNYPDPHFVTMTIVIDSESYFVFAYLCRNGLSPSLKHNKQIHAFFKKMGLKPAYVRGKHIHVMDKEGGRE